MDRKTKGNGEKKIWNNDQTKKENSKSVRKEDREKERQKILVNIINIEFR